MNEIVTQNQLKYHHYEIMIPNKRYIFNRFASYLPEEIYQNGKYWYKGWDWPVGRDSFHTFEFLSIFACNSCVQMLKKLMDLAAMKAS